MIPLINFDTQHPLTMKANCIDLMKKMSISVNDSFQLEKKEKFKYRIIKILNFYFN
jgi:hypothetical protein